MSPDGVTPPCTATCNGTSGSTMQFCYGTFCEENHFHVYNRFMCVLYQLIRTKMPTSERLFTCEGQILLTC